MGDDSDDTDSDDDASGDSDDTNSGDSDDDTDSGDSDDDSTDSTSGDSDTASGDSDDSSSSSGSGTVTTASAASYCAVGADVRGRRLLFLEETTGTPAAHGHCRRGHGHPALDGDGRRRHVDGLTRRRCEEVKM